MFTVQTNNHKYTWLQELMRSSQLTKSIIWERKWCRNVSSKVIIHNQFTLSFAFWQQLWSPAMPAPPHSRRLPAHNMRTKGFRYPTNALIHILPASLYLGKQQLWIQIRKTKLVACHPPLGHTIVKAITSGEIRWAMRQVAPLHTAKRKWRG